MKLKVLCAANPNNFHCVRHIEVLTKAGVEVHLLDNSVDFQRGSTLATTHRRWPMSGRRTLKILLGQAAADSIADWLVKVQLKSVWRGERADICHIHWIDNRVLSVANAGLRPLVVTAYGTDMNATRLSSYNPSLLRQVKEGLSQVDLFIADSEDMIQIADELAGRKLTSLLLPIGIDTDLFRPGYEDEVKAWRAELDIPASARIVLSPRVIKPNYRQIELLRAFAYAVREKGFDGCIVFKAYASDAGYVEALRDAARGLGVTERIRIINGVPYEQLPALYAMADLAVNFPIMDAFPVTFLEAGACEVPILTHHCIAYESNGMAEYLNFVVDEDVNSFGALMARLCGDAAAKERALAARRHVVHNFDEAAFGRELIGAYKTLLKRRLQ
jgi:glycosyltransferase involved in cell wall biosynthesis